MTQHWTEAAIAAALNGRFYGLDGKCRREERERERRKARELADRIRQIIVTQAHEKIAECGPLSAAGIIAAVAVAHNIGPADLVARNRSHGIITARQHACALMRQLTDLSLQSIADSVGLKDHSTVCNAITAWRKRESQHLAQAQRARQMLGVG